MENLNLTQIVMMALDAAGRDSFMQSGQASSLLPGLETSRDCLLLYLNNKNCAHSEKPLQYTVICLQT